MNRNWFALNGNTRPLAYLVLAPLALLSQHAYVAWVYWYSGQPLTLDS